MSKAKKVKNVSTAVKEYVPTPAEVEAVRAHLATRDSKALSPGLRVTKKLDGPPGIAVEHQDRLIGTVLLMEALGTTDPDFLNGLLSNIVNIGSPGKDPDEKGINFVLSVIKGIQPRDQVETLLAAQMAAVHMASMTFARRLAHVENIPQQDAAERAFNKLTRTFASQMETLKRYRTSGQQKVTVEHVTVNKGGQAIVGNVQQTGPQTTAKEVPPEPPALTDQSDNFFKMESTGRKEVVRRKRR